jgi:hypothetical protein
MPPPPVTLPEHNVRVIDVFECINAPFVRNEEVREELINEDLDKIRNHNSGRYDLVDVSQFSLERYRSRQSHLSSLGTY